MSDDNQNTPLQRRRSDQSIGQAAPEQQHNDWGHAQAGVAGSAQAGSNANIGGVAGSQHNDWGHSAVPDAGNRQSADEPAPVQGGQLPPQGVMPGEEMGHLQDAQRPVGKPRA